MRVRGNNSEKFKCNCGCDMFFQGKHHDVVICSKCETVYMNGKKLKMDYYGVTHVRKGNKCKIN